MVYDSGDYIGAMDAALKLGDWAGFKRRRAEAKKRGKYRGIGVANYVDISTGVPREKAEITVLPEGIVELVIGIASQGQGHETSFAQLISEWLGVPIEAVRLVAGDTDRVTVGGGAHSGRGMRLGSIVIKKSSDEIIEKGTRIAEHLLETARCRYRIQQRPLRREGHQSRGRPVRGGARRGRAHRPARAIARAARGGLRRDRPVRKLSLWLPRLRGRGRSRHRRRRASSTTPRSTMSGAR